MPIDSSQYSFCASTGVGSSAQLQPATMPEKNTPTRARICAASASLAITITSIRSPNTALLPASACCSGSSPACASSSRQWARALGLRLIATAGTDAKCQLALANGAAHAINYNTEDFAARVKEITAGRGVKVVYDSVGKDTWDKSLDCLRPFGLMASFGNASGPVPPFAPGSLGAKGSLYVTRQTLFTHIATRESTQAMADELFAVVASGQVKIHIDQRYPLRDVQQAHRDLEARKTTGSTILTL